MKVFIITIKGKKATESVTAEKYERREGFFVFFDDKGEVVAEYDLASVESVRPFE